MVKSLGKKDWNKSIEYLLKELQNLYREDSYPWVVGYSGGKDSTAVLQLVWKALEGIPEKERFKTVHIISTDTLVENPIVSGWVKESHKKIKEEAVKNNLPIIPYLLIPEIGDSFWVNLIGRGYPAPRYKFRWCTERLKIRPADSFVTQIVKDHGEVVMLLGTRKAESNGRAAILKREEKRRIRHKLSPSPTLPRCMIYSPIADWSNDDVWLYLMKEKNPWGVSNQELLAMYQGATADGECPLVLDTSTPSCGNSRFGCWICTLVEEDRSMSAMIMNDSEKEWMLPLLKLRNELDFRGEEKKKRDRERRDFRRMNGSTILMENGELVPGPYLKEVREHFLRELLKIQQIFQKKAPESAQDWEIITMEELKEIRRIWLEEKYEGEDTLPGIYREITGKDFPYERSKSIFSLSPNSLKILKDCSNSPGMYEMLREMLIVEQKYAVMLKRKGLYEDLENSVRRHFYSDREDAVNRLKEFNRIKELINRAEDSDDLREVEAII